MKLVNEADMMEFASGRKPDIEGRLQHRTPSNSGFRERFFKLVGNLLFYYRISDWGQVEPQPIGVIVLENYCVRPDSGLLFPFAFELTFKDDPDKRHIFTTRTEHDMNNWIHILQSSSYQYWKQQYDNLSSQLSATSQKKQGVSLLTTPNRVNPFQSLLLPEFAPPPPLPPRRSSPTVPLSPVHRPQPIAPPPISSEDLISL